jgi:transposase
MKGLTLSQREQTRLQVLNQLVGHQISAPEAAVILGLSERHTWRMLAAYREEGAAALAHGNRGRRPANAISQETRQKVIALASTRYSGFNHTHLTELLADREGLFLTRSTVRGIRAGAGIPSPRDDGGRPATAGGGSARRKRGCCCNWTAAPMTG